MSEDRSLPLLEVTFNLRSVHHQVVTARVSYELSGELPGLVNKSSALMPPQARNMKPDRLHPLACKPKTRVMSLARIVVMEKCAVPNSASPPCNSKTGCL